MYWNHTQRGSEEMASCIYFFNQSAHHLFASVEVGNNTVGERAKLMYEKENPNIRTVRPLRDGVIADFNACEQMMRGLIKKVNTGRHFFTPSLRMVPVHSAHSCTKWYQTSRPDTQDDNNSRTP
jgi:hypothetical protein